VDDTTADQATSPTAPAATPTGPAIAAAAAAGANAKKPDREARLKSGANPRTKLTEAELAAKMEQMRILSAEKTRRFEKAQRDESEHAVAYAKGMEEARKRRAEEAERRKRGEEERKRMDDERAKNRERKLAAMGSRADKGGWDLGRDHTEVEGGEDRGFRSAYGGVRGARNAGAGGGGLGGSRFAAGNEDEGRLDGRQDRQDTRQDMRQDSRRDGGGERGGGRGRGRGRGGRGRGGLFDDRAGEERGHGNGYGHNGPQRAPAPAQKPPAVDEFPALPPAKKTDTAAKVPLPPLEALSPLSPQLGGWADEVAAMDENNDA
jgi:hypothetical protein